MEERASKKARLDSEMQTEQSIETLKKKALSVLEKQLASSIDTELGDAELESLTAAQKAMMEQMRAVEVNERKRTDIRSVKLGEDVFADDWDNRLT